MTDQIIIHTLRAVRHAVAKEIAPAIQSTDAQLNVDIVGRLLEWMAIRLERGDRLKADHETALHDILDGLSKDRIGCVSELIASGDLSRFDALLDAEKLYVAGSDPEGQKSAAENYAAGRARAVHVDAAERLVNDESLTRYLRARFFEHPNIRAVGTTPLTGGFGKDTIFFSVVDGGLSDGPSVMRKDLPISPIDVLAADEFPLLQALSEHGVPVPTPLWVEQDRNWFGGGFIVVRRMPGSIDTQSWISDPGQIRAFARTLARIMARIHTLGPDDLNLCGETPKSARDGTIAAVMTMRDLFRRKEVVVNTRLEAAFSWLLKNVPSCGGAPARLVHGDIGFHNLLIENGDVTAVLDWEFAHMGDPAEDVAYVRPFVESVMPWSDFVGIYRDCGGAAYTDEQDRFYAVWRNARNAASCTGSAYAFRQAPVGSVKLATGGLIYGPRFEIEALRQIREILS